jgi:predicted nucleic acid-binding protein
MNAVDTNVLIYARDPRDPRKQQIAQDYIATLENGVLLWQVACEYIAASRKLEKLGYDSQQAWLDLGDLRRLWRPVTPTWAVMARAEALLTQYNLSFWDAMVVAACLEAGVTQLYSEDFDNSAAATGLRIINPFVI